jgi:hypothetical protein
MPHGFKIFTLPDGQSFTVPSDLTLSIPQNSEVESSMLHFLIYIPWDDKYLEQVPADYLAFFQSVLPHLAVRTTDVHVALCLPFVKELGAHFKGEFDERVVYLAFILHDVGWSRLSELEIAQSLGVSGLELTPDASAPKEKHATVGKKLAAELLKSYDFQPPLSAEQTALILDSVLYHDQPAKLSGPGDIPLELKLVCDADHLWFFTRQNFWQDTVRKNIPPQEYLQNLERDLSGYFTTEPGRDLARQLLAQRQAEVAQLTRL